MCWTSTPIVLEAGRGFFKAAGGGYDAHAIDGKLGNFGRLGSSGNLGRLLQPHNDTLRQAKSNHRRGKSNVPRRAATFMRMIAIT